MASNDVDTNGNTQFSDQPITYTLGADITYVQGEYCDTSVSNGSPDYHGSSCALSTLNLVRETLRVTILNKPNLAETFSIIRVTR